MTSNNYSGQCCSVRWFVPLLAPGYYLLALFLRENPFWRPAHLILGGWGVVLGALMGSKGPWIEHMVPYYWPVQVAAFVTLAGYWHWRRRFDASRSMNQAVLAETRAAA
jgi:hypothetical protein